MTTPICFKLSVSPVKIPFNAVIASSSPIFLNEARSPASPTRLVLILEASPCVSPIDVAISPKRAAISNAEPSAIPKASKVVFAKLSTSPAESPKAT